MSDHYIILDDCLVRTSDITSVVCDEHKCIVEFAGLHSKCVNTDNSECYKILSNVDYPRSNMNQLKITDDNHVQQIGDKNQYVRIGLNKINTKNISNLYCDNRECIIKYYIGSNKKEYIRTYKKSSRKYGELSKLSSEKKRKK